MKTWNHLYKQIISFENLILAWKKARIGKTKKPYVIEFENDIFYQLMTLHYELKYGTYNPKPLKTFVIRDPKTRKISKSEFRDRIVHHAVVSILEPIFDKLFIFDSCSNRIGKGNTFALKRLGKFVRKVSHNGECCGWWSNNQIKGYCLKADIRHYFEEINHAILMALIRKKVRDTKVLNLIEKINTNFRMKRESSHRGQRHAKECL